MLRSGLGVPLVSEKWGEAGGRGRWVPLQRVVWVGGVGSAVGGWGLPQHTACNCGLVHGEKGGPVMVFRWALMFDQKQLLFVWPLKLKSADHLEVLLSLSVHAPWHVEMIKTQIKTQLKQNKPVCSSLTQFSAFSELLFRLAGLEQQQRGWGATLWRDGRGDARRCKFSLGRDKNNRRRTEEDIYSWGRGKASLKCAGFHLLSTALLEICTSDVHCTLFNQKPKFLTKQAGIKTRLYCISNKKKPYFKDHAAHWTMQDYLLGFTSFLLVNSIMNVCIMPGNIKCNHLLFKWVTMLLSVTINILF